MERKRNGREEPDEVRIFFGFSPGGEAAARRRLMRGELAWPNDEREGRAKSALIRRCGATFSLRAKSRLRRLRSDTRLRAQPLGEGFREGGKPCLQK